MPIVNRPDRIIVMKVGLHLSEPWESIVERKLAEERVAGVAYWGYGGAACHPMTQVQPFARSGRPVAVLMIRTASDFHGTVPPAVSESVDGTIWRPVPTGVVTTGRYALTIHALRRTDEELDLGAYEVGIGPTAGRPLIDYLRARVDKACARLAAAPRERRLVPLALRAELVAPYAVLLRST